MSAVLPFPATVRPDRGTIHVWGDGQHGFDVSHESASGGSWGELHWFASGQDAIAAAYLLNRDTYSGACNVFVCDAAVQDGSPDVGLPSLPGDF